MRCLSFTVLASLALLGAASAQDGVRLHYDASAHEESIAAEQSLSVSIAGNEVLANFVRSLHPFLSLQSLTMKVEGTHQGFGKKHKVQFDDARLAVLYDDESYDYDWKRTEPPEDLATNKLEGFFWIVAMAPRSYSLSAKGEYHSDDPNQDHNGEALDLFLNGVTRLKEDPVAPGESWTAEWKGSRTEKNKSAKWAFKQVVTFEKLGERDGSRIATLSSKLEGRLEGDEDPSADEKWTKCSGKTRVVLEVASGRVLELWGAGTITAYYRKTGDDGSKQDLTLKFGAEGKRAVRK
jgi:hypothetical protein